MSKFIIQLSMYKKIARASRPRAWAAADCKNILSALRFEG